MNSNTFLLPCTRCVASSGSTALARQRKRLLNLFTQIQRFAQIEREDDSAAPEYCTGHN